MTIGAAHAQELKMEAETTRRVLERVPEHQLTWRPHAKSMSLGQLALHVATLPDRSSVSSAAMNWISVPPLAVHQTWGSYRELLDAWDASLTEATSYLEALSLTGEPQRCGRSNRARRHCSRPRSGVLRSLLFNHWYHHRGQLTVHLRLLDVPLPSVYGPTADENPFSAGLTVEADAPALTAPVSVTPNHS